MHIHIICSQLCQILLFLMSHYDMLNLNICIFKLHKWESKTTLRGRGIFHLMEVKQLCMLTNNTGLHEKISKEDIFKNVGNQTVAGSHWLPQYGKILWKSLATINWLPTFLKISSFLFNRRNKLLLHPIIKILSFTHRPPFPNLY